MSETSFPKNQINILLLENIHPVATDLLRKEGFHVENFPKALDEDELKVKIAQAHILGIRSKTQVTPAVLEQGKKLLSVGCFCIGTNQVALDKANSLGVPVFNAPYSNTRSVAEMVLGEVVMLSRKLSDKSAAAHKGEWLKEAKNCFEVRGKTLGIIGYGHIGSQVSILAEAFGMRVLYYDIVTKMPLGNSRQVEKLEDLLKESHFVTLHVPETPHTKNMMGAKEFKAMRKGSHLINASRGTVVDIGALKAALVEKHLEGAAIDVFPVEPESNKDVFKSEIQGLPNVILTPHIGGSTEEAQQNIGVEVAQTILKFINNGSTTGAVNFPNVDLPLHHKTHRILNVHKNVPGVLKEINGILSDVGANISGQFLSTDPNIGYLIVDVDSDVSRTAKDKIAALPTSIKTRILF